MEGSGDEESLSSTSFSFHHSVVDDSDAYFELDLRPGFEFRLLFSSLVPFPGFTTATATATASLSSIPTTAPSQPPATPCEINTWGLVHARKMEPANKSTMMMKLLVKLRSMVSLRSGEARVERWLRKQSRMKEVQLSLRNNKFFRNPFNTANFPSATSSIINSSSPPLFHQPAAAGGGDHASSLLHSAIAHCKKSMIP